MFKYWKLQGFRDLYLEDSWVLDIVARPGLLEFTMDLVLRESHPLYQPPPPTEQYCYLRGTIRFGDVKELLWADQGKSPTADIEGDFDYDSIRSFLLSKGIYSIEGRFGRISVTSAPPQVIASL